MPISDAKIRSLKPTAKDQWVNDGHGLYIRVRRQTKTFVLRRKLNGKTRIVTLGPWHDPQLTVKQPEALSLKEARIKAQEYSPTEERRKEVAALTVKDVCREYVREFVDPVHKRPEMFVSYLRNALYPDLADTLIADVVTPDLTVLVRDYANERSKRGADQFRSVLKQVFGYAVEMGYIPHNPAADITRRITKYKYKPRDRFLTEGEIKHIWHADSIHTPLLRWLLVTGARISEAQRATWASLEKIKGGTRWHIPAEHSKNGEAHWCFIPPIGVKILKGRDADREWIFSERTTTNVQAWLKRWCEREGVEPRFTPHDLRRTFSTHLNGLGVPFWVVEKMLNHRLEGVAAVYNKAELEPERIDAAKRWGEFLEAST